MQQLFKARHPLRSILLIAILLFAAYQSNGQPLKPSQSGYAPVNGTQVYYEVYGEGRALVLLHGAFMTIGMNWGQLIPELSKSRKVIAIELQGHGHSPLSDRTMAFPALARDVEGVLDYLKIDSADVAGYSMGGSVAYQFAIQSPKRLRKLVIISSTYKSSGWLPEVTHTFKTMRPEFIINSPLRGAYNAVAPDTTKWTRFVEHMIGFVSTEFDMGDSNISKIHVPVLIISGDNDGLDKVELMKTYQLLGGGVSADMGRMPTSKLAILPSQSHVGVMMQTSTILSYVEQFLK